MNFIKERDYTKPRVMQHGDLVIVYERHDSLDHFFIQTNAIFNNKYGTFHHNDMIGKPFGTKINSKTSPGYIYLLEPTPELWSTALHTRTQIVDEVDSSVVTLYLDVHPGCTVVETGTGSGCMTMSLARAVYPSGHVYTYEYNGVRAQKAREEFDKLGVGQLITVTHRDVCSSSLSTPSSSSTTPLPPPPPLYCDKPGGFPNVPDGGADAVFLDLPEPWLVLEHVLRVLKPGRTMCSYSPCIEQVIKTCEKLRELKFHSIRMIEVRQRPYDARVMELETLDLGLSPEGDFLNNRSARDMDNRHQRYAQRDRVTPVFEARTSSVAGEGGAQGAAEAEAEGGTEGDRDDDEGGDDGEQDDQEGENNSDSDGEEGRHDTSSGTKRGGGRGSVRDDSQANKRRKIRFRAPAAETAPATNDGKVQVYTQGGMSDAHFRTLQNRIKNRPVSSVNGTYEMHIARPISGMKGHTAFLTFAVAPLSR